MSGKSANLLSPLTSPMVSVPVVFHFDRWSTKAVIVFVVVGGIVSESSVMSGWDFLVVSLEVAITCIFKCRKCMRPCVVSMTTLLFLIKCNSTNGPVHFFITTKCSPDLMFTNSNLSMVVSDAFFLAICYFYLKNGRIVDFENNNLGFFFYFVQVIPNDCTDKCSRVHQGIYLYVILCYSRNPEAHRAFVVFVSGLL